MFSFFLHLKIKSVILKKKSYHLKCMDCDADYIGKSERILNERVLEHLKDKEYHVFQHIHNEKHRIDVENIKILD